MVLLATLILAASAVLAAARRLPVWGHTWIGAAVMAVLFVLVAGGDDRSYLVSPAVDVLILIAILLMLGAALGAASWRAARGFTWQGEVLCTVFLWGWLVAVVMAPALLRLLPHPDKPLQAG